MNEVAPFRVNVAVCSHRDVKVAVWENLWALGGCPNPKVTIKIWDGDALISRVRSRAATWFLEKTNDDILMFIDDDVSLSAFDATKLMNEAFQLKLPIVGAAYVTKSKGNPGFAVRPLENRVEMMFGEEGKIYEMRSISTGCMVIRREVLEKFVSSGIAPKCCHGNTFYYPFFQHEKMVINGAWEDVSEDWYFCEKAIKLGYKVYCDTTIHTKHIGPYEYDWNDVVEARSGVRKQHTNIRCRMGDYSLRKEVEVAA
mgnify:CR=1 FL=1